jgi:hypothetical protein
MEFLSTIKTKLTYGAHLRPARDWFLLLWVCAFLLVASVCWNAWLFNQVTNGVVIGNPSQKPAAVFNKASVTTVQNVFTDRAAKEAQYQTGAYNFIDPSK